MTHSHSDVPALALTFALCCALGCDAPALEPADSGPPLADSGGLDSGQLDDDAGPRDPLSLPTTAFETRLTRTMDSGRFVELIELTDFRCLQPDDPTRAEETWGNHEIAIVYPLGWQDGDTIPVIYMMRGGPPGWVDMDAPPGTGTRLGNSWGSRPGQGLYRGFMGHGQAAWVRQWIMDALAEPEGSYALFNRARERFVDHAFVIAPNCSNDAYAGRGEENPDGRRYGFAANVATLRMIHERHGITELMTFGNSGGGMGGLLLAERLADYLPELPLRGVVESSIAAEVPEIRQLFIDARSTDNRARISLADGSFAWSQCTDTWRPDLPHSWENLDLLEYSASARIRDGRIDVPIAHVFNQHDPQFCMARQYSAEHLHGAIVEAIGEVNPGGASESFEVCVGGPLPACADDDGAMDCDRTVDVPCSLHGILNDPLADSGPLHEQLLDWLAARSEVAR